MDPIPGYNHSQLCQTRFIQSKRRPHYKLHLVMTTSQPAQLAQSSHQSNHRVSRLQPLPATTSSSEPTKVSNSHSSFAALSVDFRRSQLTIFFTTDSSDGRELTGDSGANPYIDPRPSPPKKADLLSCCLRRPWRPPSSEESHPAGTACSRLGGHASRDRGT